MFTITDIPTSRLQTAIDSLPIFHASKWVFYQFIPISYSDETDIFRYSIFNDGPDQELRVESLEATFEEIQAELNRRKPDAVFVR